LLAAAVALYKKCDVVILSPGAEKTLVQSQVRITMASGLVWLISIYEDPRQKAQQKALVGLLLASFTRVTRVTRMAYSPSLWLMAIGW
jgi:hypothetical protein